MRLLTILLVTTLLSSCSWWPWGDNKTGNCLDDDTCEGANPFEEQLIGGTWYCYGVAKDRPWDCSQEKDDNKISAIDDDAPPAPAVIEVQGRNYDVLETDDPDLQLLAEQRAEVTLTDDISSSGQTTKVRVSRSPLDDHADDSYAVQLIALQTLEEVSSFAADYALDASNHVKIHSQGTDWYVLLLGVYSTKSEADAAAADWEANHDAFSKPWVRPVGPLKDAAKQAERQAD